MRPARFELATSASAGQARGWTSLRRDGGRWLYVPSYAVLATRYASLSGADFRRVGHFSDILLPRSSTQPGSSIPRAVLGCYHRATASLSSWCTLEDAWGHSPPIPLNHAAGSSCAFPTVAEENSEFRMGLGHHSATVLLFLEKC